MDTEYKHTQHTMCITRNHQKHHQQNIHHIIVHNKDSWSERNSQAGKSHCFRETKKENVDVSRSILFILLFFEFLACDNMYMYSAVLPSQEPQPTC